MTDVYRYSLKSTGFSSERYGPCEVCKQHCSEVFHQSETRRYELDDADRAALRCTDTHGWTHYQCRDAWGHEQCLIGLRR